MKKEDVIQRLLESTQKYGLADTLAFVFGKNIHVNIGFSPTACRASIEELALSVRSHNALRRTGIETLGQLISWLNENNLKTIRNLGNKSIREIQIKTLTYGFEQLTAKEQAAFFGDLIENNTIE